MEKIIGSILVILILIGIWITLNSGFQKTIENQDKMLCESAKVSGNIEYGKKCGCYYKTGDIKCLSKK